VQLPGRIATGLMALACQTGRSGGNPTISMGKCWWPVVKPEKTIAADSFLFKEITPI